VSTSISSAMAGIAPTQGRNADEGIIMAMHFMLTDCKLKG
jgi:hypothetical protein